MSARVPVTFEPSGAVGWVERGVTLLEAARVAGVPISASCGGRGVCGSCGVRVTGGEFETPTPDETAALGRAPSDVRLACRARVSAPVTVRPIVVMATGAPPASLSERGPFVVGIDLGTTMVGAAAVHAGTGREVGRASIPNRQASFGGDVLSRVTAALSGHADELRAAAEDSLLAALDAVVGEARSEVERLVVAGNSVMSALLLGADVSTLAAAPFTAPAIRGREVSARLRDRLGETVSVEVVPPIAAFVGGDVLAGLVGLDVFSHARPVMLVDIGTNAEVAVWNAGRLTVTSAPAGPAFEGGGVASGGPAVEGAVVSVRIDDRGEVDMRTLGSADPRWYSGAGLVSALAALRSSGHVDSDGRMHAEGPLASRFTADAAGVLGVRMGTDESPLLFTQLDVRALQLAKSAVRVAISAALDVAGVRAEALEHVWVAGAFGGALAADDLVSLGMVPSSVRDAVRSPGNTSLMGAVAMALDPEAARRADEPAAEVRWVDLAGASGFGERLMAGVELAAFD